MAATTSTLLQDTVLSLPELLESILVQLPMRDLVRVQRVSHAWYDSITKSPTLQKKLFFRPILNNSLHQRRIGVEVNPLLEELFPPFFRLSTPDNETDWNFQGLTPLDFIRRQRWFVCESRQRAVLRPDASWRRMFPSHPPPQLKNVDIMLLGCCLGASQLTGAIAKEHQHLQENGARMGLIWDAAVFAVDDFPNGDFWLSWHISDTCGNDAPGAVPHLTVHTEHEWDCFGDDDVPCGLDVVRWKRLIEYQYSGDITDLQAEPFSWGGGE